MTSDFSEFFAQAMGEPDANPYPFQARIARDGLPELLECPTGLGKTEAVLLAWLYRLLATDDEAVRTTTPRRLVLAFPMRVLVEQTVDRVQRYLDNLNLGTDVTVRRLMGGEPMWLDGDYWAGRPEDPAIVVGTIDMVISRCLMRGYGSSRGLWPIDFGLLSNDTHFVFDEVQLMGPALPTARQLQAFRDRLGVYRPTHSTYMSATVNREGFDTVDSAAISSVVALGADDLDHTSVHRRVTATKTVGCLELDDLKNHDKVVAAHVTARHRPGTLSLVITNTVDRANAVAKQLDTDAEVIVLHSRFRPPDRAKLVERATAADIGEAGRIIVSTQVVEAGVDLSAAVLTTDAAPWSSIVQRAGRCNRAGIIDDAELWWVPLGERQAAPYEWVDVSASMEQLRTLEGASLSPSRIGELRVAEQTPLTAHLRTKDLYDLFDTAPDASGNDVEIGRFIRDDLDDLDVAVAWRADVGAEATAHDAMPGRDERCPVPLRSFAKWWKSRDRAARRKVCRWDATARRWVQVASDDLRPGLVVVVDATLGGYTPNHGWSHKSKTTVDIIGGSVDGDSTPSAEGANDLGSLGEADETHPDPLSVAGGWVTLSDHLADAEREATAMVGDLLGPLPADHRSSVVEAAAWHDVGKAHPMFQQALQDVAESVPAVGDVFAKSGGSGRLRFKQRGFRHEFLTALWLLALPADAGVHLTDPDLVVYLAAAHHGKVRVALRGVGADAATYGLSDGDSVDAVTIREVTWPAFTVDLSLQRLGSVGQANWKERSLSLLNRNDLGPFRLAYLEAMVRLADWRASAQPDRVVTDLVAKPAASDPTGPHFADEAPIDQDEAPIDQGVPA